MLRSTFFRIGFVIAILLVWLAPDASAQYPGYVTNNNDTGMPNYGSFISSEIDTVNLANGGLMLHIPILSRKGRGLDYSVYFDYQSKYWVMDTSFVQTPYPNWTSFFNWQPDATTAAWNFRDNAGGYLDWSEQTYTCSPLPNGEQPTVVVRSNWVYIAGDGSKHQLPLRENVPIFLPGLCGDGGPGDQLQNLQAHTDDGHIFVDISQDKLNDHSGIKITRRDGSQDAGSNPAFRRRDTNGNYFSSSNNTDTLGRPLMSSGNVCTGSQSTFSYTDSNGATQNIVVNCIQLSLKTSFPTTSYFDSYHVVNQYTGSMWVVSKITLPNGLAYTFSYADPNNPGQTNPFGEITQITLPTGGYIKYKWTTLATTDPGPRDPNPNSIYDIYMDSRVIAERDVSLDGVNEQVWTYSSGKVTDPLGNSETHSFANNLSCGTNQINYSNQPPVAAGVSYYDATGKLLKSVIPTLACDSGPLYSSQEGMDLPAGSIFTQGARNVRTIRTTTTLADTNQVSKTETDYTDCFNYTVFPPPGGQGYSETDCRVNPTATREYDFGSGSPGPLLRSSSITYLHNVPTTGTPYLNAHIWDRVAQKTIYDGNGNQVAAATYSYDGTTITGTSSAPNHDYTNYSTSNTVRGNVTSVSRWLGTTNSWLTTTNYYNDVGNLVQTTDPGGHTYTLNYIDNFTDGINRNSQGFLTSVTSPTTNGVNHIEGKQYFFNTGLTAAICGQNASNPANCSNATSSGPDFTKYAYDGLGRPLTVTHGDGGVTNFTFTEPSSPSPSNPITVSLSSAIDSSHNLVNTAVIDTLGRVIETQSNSDPGGIDKVDTTYDVLGRKSTTSNPYRSSGDPTYGITTFNYDALGRSTTVIPPDGVSTSNNVTSTYSGNSVTVTDQAGKQRRSFTDGLGRLIEVDEPGAPAGNPASNGYVVIGGNLQYYGVPGSGTVTITGSEQSTQVYQQPTCTLYDCGGNCIQWSGGGWVSVYDSGLVSLTVNGHTDNMGYGQGDTPSTIATNMVNRINGDSNAFVTASASGAVITLTARTNGVSTDYSWSTSVQYDSTDFSGASFSTSPTSSSLTGGVNNFPDTGSVWVNIGGNQASVTYGSGSTASSVASALATAINNAPSYPVTASASGGTVNFTEKTQGTSPSITAGSSTNQHTYFSQPSFTASTFNSFLNATNNTAPKSLLTPAITLYTYDTLDDLICVEQHGNVSGTGCSSSPSNDATSAWRVRRFTYDSLKRLVSVKNPESGTTSYTYDADSNVLTKTSPLANQTGSSTVTVTYTYDQLHRITQRSYSDSTPTVKISYDGTSPTGCSPTLTSVYPVGRQSAMCDGAGWEAWSYDVRGHVITDRRNTNSITKDTIYAYNFAGAETSVTYPSGRTINYTYNAAGQVVSAVDGSTGVNYASNAAYNATGALASLQNSTSINSNMFYNKRLQPCRISVKSSGTAPSSCSDTNVGNILDYTYNFSLGAENNGNVTSVTNNNTLGRSQSFTYDELNRISTAVAQATSGQFCWGQDFTYDAWANLTNIILDPNRPGCSATGLSVAMVGNNQLSAPPYHYDAVGNLTGDGTNSYTFNAENQVTTVAGVTYTYDGRGARVKKSSGKLYWNGDGSEPLDETDASGNLTDEYVFFGGVRIARRDASNNVVYYFSDHLGTTHVVTNSSGTILDDSDFYPFGGERAVTSSSGNAYKFTGKERDTESGLDNFGARYYASTTGRFLSPDDTKYASLADPQTWNLYSYVSNHPLTMTDPTGHSESGCLTCTMPHMDGGGSPNAVGYGMGTSVAAETITIFDAVTSSLDPQGTVGTGNNQQRRQTAQEIANQIPQAVKDAIQESLDASNAPSECACDFTGGFHEEAGLAGYDVNRNLVISPEKPGPAKNPDVESDRAHTSGVPVDQEVRNLIATPTVSWHIHPKGETQTHHFVQGPSPADHMGAIQNTINIVVGARDKTVYFYDSSNHVTHMRLDQFMR
jgi:RHS repeat-associated protein